MKLSRVLVVFIFFIHIQSFGQDKPVKGYFMFPIKPGQQNYMAGNMGELRATHFHAGIDIKTDAREGLSVYAAAEGYVSRVKISTTGYGNVVYLTHPNGFTTVYAHLQSISEPLAKYVKQNQYDQQSFEIEICINKDQFVFKKGDVIGLSGNSGSSGGPHLHFEIRDSLENFWDPLLFGFTEIVDNLPPVIEKLAIKTLDINGRVNGEFGRLEFKTELVGKDYVINEPISAKGLIGLEILAYDKADQVSNKYGIYSLELKVDNNKIFEHKIDRMPFGLARDVLIDTDFEVATKSGKRFEKLFIDDGNYLQIYQSINKGKIRIDDSTTHLVEVKLTDAYNNSRKLTFRIKGKQALQFNVIGKVAGNTPAPHYNLQENVVKIICKENANNRGVLAKVFSGYKSYELTPAYKYNTNYVYLWDLRTGLPDSVSLCSQTLLFGFSGLIPTGKEYNFYGKFADIRFEQNSLFDTLYLDVKKIDNMFKIQNPYIPLFDYTYITLRPTDAIPNKSKTSVYSVNSSNSHLYEGGSWNDDGSITFKTKYFNYFVLFADTLPPTIKYISKTPESIRFAISDNLSGIGNYRATLNGEWLLMNYDYKKKLLWSASMNSPQLLRGDFELVVTDNVGNKNIFRSKL